MPEVSVISNVYRRCNITRQDRRKLFGALSVLLIYGFLVLLVTIRDRHPHTWSSLAIIDEVTSGEADIFRSQTGSYDVPLDEMEIMEEPKNNSKPFFQSRNRDYSKAVVTIFTTFKDSPEKRYIHKNMIQNLRNLHPYVIPVMYYSQGDEGLIKYGTSNEWDYYPVPRATKRGLPVLRNMFLHAQRHYKTPYFAYSNSDILYTTNLIDTLKGLKSYAEKQTHILLVGRRTNINVTMGQNIASLKEVEDLAEKGELFRIDAEDYFISTRDGYPWRDIPDFVVGRIAYDNWLLINGIVNNMTVIDASNTILAVHQTDEDGTYAGHMRDRTPSPDKNINKALAGKDYKFHLGRSDCVFHYTIFNNVTKEISVLPRDTSQTECVKFFKYYKQMRHLIPKNYVEFSDNTAKNQNAKVVNGKDGENGDTTKTVMKNGKKIIYIRRRKHH